MSVHSKSRRALLTLLVALTLSVAPASAQAKRLAIPAVQQNLSNWCWLAVGEMVFRYYRVPNINPAGVYQCGMAGAVFGGVCANDCRYCNVGSGPADTIKQMISYYPGVVRQLGLSAPDLGADLDYSSLSEGDLIDEIDADRPVIAGISPHSGLLPPGLSEHAVLIIGYDETDDGLVLYVNDPFPYAAVGQLDPYSAKGGRRISAGRYAVSYETMVDELYWGNSIYGIE